MIGLYPVNMWLGGSTGSYRTNDLDGTVTRQAWPVGWGPATQAVDRVSIYLSAVTSPGQGLHVEFQRAHATTGDPSNTAITNGQSNTIAAGSLTTGWNHFTFPTNPTLNKGEAYWLVLKWDGAHSSGSVTCRAINRSAGRFCQDYDTAWGTFDNNFCANALIRTAAGTFPQYEQVVASAETGDNRDGSTRTVKAAGIRFQVPEDCTLIGFAGVIGINDDHPQMAFAITTSATDPDPANATHLHQVGDDGAGGDAWDLNASGTWHEHIFKTSYALTKDTWYRLIFDGPDFTVYWCDHAEAAAIEQTVGTEFFHTWQSAGSDLVSGITDHTSRMPQCALIVEWTPSGGGGGNDSIMGAGALRGGMQ